MRLGICCLRVGGERFVVSDTLRAEFNQNVKKQQPLCWIQAVYYLECTFFTPLTRMKCSLGNEASHFSHSAYFSFKTADDVDLVLAPCVPPCSLCVPPQHVSAWCQWNQTIIVSLITCSFQQESENWEKHHFLWKQNWSYTTVFARILC